MHKYYNLDKPRSLAEFILERSEGLRMTHWTLPVILRNGVTKNLGFAWLFLVNLYAWKSTIQEGLLINRSGSQSTVRRFLLGLLRLVYST